MIHPGNECSLGWEYQLTLYARSLGKFLSAKPSRHNLSWQNLFDLRFVYLLVIGFVVLLIPFFLSYCFVVLYIFSLSYKAQARFLSIVFPNFRTRFTAHLSFYYSNAFKHTVDRKIISLKLNSLNHTTLYTDGQV